MGKAGYSEAGRVEGREGRMGGRDEWEGGREMVGGRGPLQ